jgi:pyruvate dehydrogenase phosphatase
MDRAGERSFKAWDNNTYSLTPEYPNAFSYVNDTGVRYFAERFKCYRPSDPPSGVYPLLPRPQLLQKVAEKSRTGSRTVNIAAGKLTVSHVSFQAYKKHNEDRTFVHEFPDGLLFGVLDGMRFFQLSRKT